MNKADADSIKIAQRSKAYQIAEEMLEVRPRQRNRLITLSIVDKCNLKIREAREILKETIGLRKTIKSRR